MSSTIPGSGVASATATSALTDKQYYALKGGLDTAVIASSAGEKILGILQDQGTIAAGAPCNIVLHGRTLAKCEGTIATPGTKLTVSATSNKVGWLKALSANSQECCGYSLTAGVDGDLFEVFLDPGMSLNSYADAT